jgi:hypothetical protein
VTQSFYLLRIKCETFLSSGDELSIIDEMVFDSEDDISLDSLTCNPIFGWTMGTSSSVMECISEINRLCRMQFLNAVPVSTASVSLKLSRMVFEDANETELKSDADSCPHQDALPTDNNEGRAMRLHLRAFKAATIIYYHSTFHDTSPQELAPYVSEVFVSLSAFVKTCGGNYTLWPVFIAGVEVYTEKDKDRFMELFDNASRVGMRNRVQVKAIIERVWDIRATKAAETGQKVEEIKVDWKKVKRELGIDVLIL